MKFRPLHFLLALLVLSGATGAASAGVSAGAGPFRVEVATDPPTIPVGPAKLLIRLSDSSGKPVEGAIVAALAQMPGMPMGEKEEAAEPVAGRPGVYAAPARFQMAGGYNATVRISGPAGAATATIPLKTGQNTGGLSGEAGARPPLTPLLFTLGAVALLLFTLYRMRKTGQRVNVRPAFTLPVIASLLLLALIYLGSRWAVQRYKRPGQMSVIEAQAMDMTAMKPPVGAVPVAAMGAKRQPIGSVLNYSGSAVSYVDQDVFPRVTGWVTWMPLYPGDRVNRGQLVARLDASELSSRLNEQEAARSMAEHAEAISRDQYRQSLANRQQGLAQVSESQSDLASSRSDLAGARGERAAAVEDRANAQADVESARAALPNAQAQLAAAEADQSFQAEQIRRSQTLVEQGAISREEFQQDRARKADADAKVRQARSQIDQARAGVRGARSRLRKADAMIAAADSRIAAMGAKIRASQAKIAQSRANARALAAASATAERQIAQSGAGVRQARAQVNTARVVQGYTEIRSMVDGVVTQRLIGPGVLVNPGQAILKVSQIRPIRLQANVAEADLAAIRVGDPVRVRSSASPGKDVSAKVTSVFPAVDPTARTAVVEALYPNEDGRFLPGQYLTMDITTRQKRDALVVPAGAVTWQPKATSAILAAEKTPKVWVLTAGQPAETIYTCTMHPQVKQKGPGRCPI